jgi:hypothetical protein
MSRLPPNPTIKPLLRFPSGLSRMPDELLVAPADCGVGLRPNTSPRTGRGSSQRCSAKR